MKGERISIIEVFIEAGPKGKNSANGNTALRLGFEKLFAKQKELFRARGIRLSLTVCGPRTAAYNAFKSEFDRKQAGKINALLVDSEEALSEKGTIDANARKQHLISRVGDQWDLKGVKSEWVHLMVQCMETWLLADADAMSRYYGQGFHRKSMPERLNLEQEPKADVQSKLDAATRPTQKGIYHKVDHASQLLALIDPDLVQKRCPHFGIFADWLELQGSTN